jgi:hypothetical protein
VNWKRVCTYANGSRGETDIFPRRGDVMLSVCHGSWLSQIILQSEEYPGETRARVTHSGVMMDGEDVAEAIGGKGFVLRPFVSTYRKPKYGVLLARRNDLTDKEIDGIRGGILKRLGQGYPWWKLLTQRADYWVSQFTGKDWRIFRRLGHLDKDDICSEAVDEIYAEVGKPIAQWPCDTVSPDDIWDVIVASAVPGGDHTWSIVFVTDDLNPLLPASLRLSLL